LVYFSRIYALDLTVTEYCQSDKYKQQNPFQGAKVWLQ
jgi:hypothetical protein